jgi:EAL domain-containing protein (putative c-di-GMP-specific phosphodiesterase class I)
MLPIVQSDGPTPGSQERRSCLRCETLPSQTDVGGDLHCWFPTAHVANKMRTVLSGLGLSSVPSSADGHGFTVPGAAMDRVVAACREHLSDVERDDTRTLLTGFGCAPSAEDLPRIEPLARLIARVGSMWLVDMLRDQRLTSHFQPIVLASSPDTVYGHEALLRGVAADGELVSPQRLFQCARDSGLTFQLDLAARRSAIACASQHRLRGKLFVNFAPTAIYDPASCLRSTVAAVDQAGIARSDVVFEIVETERAHDPRHLRNILDYYRGAGFRVALDDVGAGYSSLNLIHELRPDLLKLDMELIRGVDLDPYKARIVANLLDVARALGIDTLAEGIETDGEREWVAAHGATYLQGFLIARPSASPRSGPSAGTAPGQTTRRALPAITTP